MTFSNGVDFIVELNKNGQSRVVIDEYYDFFDYLYGHRLNLVAPRMANVVENSGKFAPIYYVLNKQLFYLSKIERLILVSTKQENYFKEMLIQKQKIMIL